MSDVTNASIILPPTETDREPTNTAITAASTSAVAITGGNWYEFTALTANVWIRFGYSSSVATATTANGGLIVAGTTRSWNIPSNVTHFKAIGDTTGTLSWGKSS